MPNDWNNDEPLVKEDAAYKFCQKLEEDKDNIRARCKADPKTARDTLREAGDFINMPEDLPVRVFEDNREEAGVLVTIRLPKKGQLPPRQLFNIDLVWPCTWTPYGTLNNPQTRREFLERFRAAK